MRNPSESTGHVSLLCLCYDLSIVAHIFQPTAAHRLIRGLLSDAHDPVVGPFQSFIRRLSLSRGPERPRVSKVDLLATVDLRSGFQQLQQFLHKG